MSLIKDLELTDVTLDTVGKLLSYHYLLKKDFFKRLDALEGR